MLASLRQLFLIYSDVISLMNSAQIFTFGHNLERRHIHPLPPGAPPQEFRLRPP